MTISANLEQAAIIGLGANLDNPADMIRQALGHLKMAPGLDYIAVSSIYLTEPQGGPEGQNWYHNAVAFFLSQLPPEDLLALLLNVEAEMGRQRLERWGPRIIDIDFLAQGGLVVEDTPGLIVPHPRMHQRLFVMAPLAEINPHWRHPVLNRTALEILADIDPSGQGVKKLGEAL